MRLAVFLCCFIVACSYVLQSQPHPGPLVSDAMRLSELGDHAGAIRLLNAALAVDSLQPQAYILLASAFLSSGRSDSALYVCDRGRVRYPGDPVLTLTRADALTALGRYDEALAQYLKVHGRQERGEIALPGATFTAVRSRLSMLYAWKAQGAFEVDAFESAVALLRQALQYQPSDPGFYASLALVHLRMENWAEADRVAATGLEAVGPDSSLLRLRARAQYELKDYRGLLLTAERLNSLAPGKPDVHLLHAEALLLNERTVEGLAKLASMIELFPDVRESYRALVQLHRKRLDFRGVTNILEKEAKRFPDDPDVHGNLAETYEILGEWEKAREAYRAFGVTSDDTLAGALMRARTFERQDSLSGAIREYRRILHTNPGEPDALAALGKVYTRQNRWHEAAMVFDQLHRVRPDALVSGQLGWALEQSGRLSEARAYFERAVGWQTPDPLSYYRLSIMTKDTSVPRAFELAETALRKALAAVEQAQQAVLQDASDAQSGHRADKREEREQHEEAGRMVETVFYYMLNQFEPADLSLVTARILELHPGSGRLHHLNGVLQRKIGNNEAALEQFQLGARYSPGHAEAHSALGAEWESRENYAEALVSYERALALEPATPRRYADVLRVAEKQGRLEWLCDRWLARHRAKRDNHVLREALVEALHKAGRLEGAAEILKEGSRSQKE